MSVETVASRQRELGRAMQNVEAFLCLVGFIALLLGAIGMAGAMQVYVRHKLATVAVLVTFFSFWQMYLQFTAQAIPTPFSPV